MTNPSDDARVAAARDILHEHVDLDDHGDCIRRVGQLEAACDMLLRFVDEQ